jgi:hypothetical protein
METYKIRLTPAQNRHASEETLELSCDHAAVRYGQRSAAAGDRLEVFRAGECIFLSEDLGPRQARTDDR